MIDLEWTEKRVDSCGMDRSQLISNKQRPIKTHSSMPIYLKDRDQRYRPYINGRPSIPLSCSYISISFCTESLVLTLSTTLNPRFASSARAIFASWCQSSPGRAQNRWLCTVWEYHNVLYSKKAVHAIDLQHLHSSQVVNRLGFVGERVTGRKQGRNFSKIHEHKGDGEGRFPVRACRADRPWCS